MDHGRVTPARARRHTKSKLLPIAMMGLATGVASAGDLWASRVVYAVHDGAAIHDPGTPPSGATPLTFGPFNPANPLWQSPESVLGQPNTLDYDDLTGFGPVPGGFAGGPMRRVHLAWPSWQYGSGDPVHLGERPGWLDGRRMNGVGLTQSSQVVVEFDEPVINNPNDGGAFHWGIDLIVHGNAAFAVSGAVAASANLNALSLTGGILAEPVEIAVAQFPEGPWFIAPVEGDGLFPTQPWSWDRDAGAWSGEAQNWAKPVDPALVLADFSGLSAADGIDLYAGSAGGAGVDLDHLTDESGEAVALEWIRFVRFRDPEGLGGEICGVADVPPGMGCGVADLAPPFGILDLADIGAFVTGFTGGDPIADLAAPTGVLDLADISAFVGGFTGGCP